MNNPEPVVMRMLAIILAVGLTMGGITNSWSAEVASAASQPITSEPNTKPVALVDGRMLAIGLGVMGGVAVYSFLTRGWGWGLGVGAARFARAGMPGMGAARLGGVGFWGGPCLSTASGVVGAMVGDWIYRNNHTAD